MPKPDSVPEGAIAIVGTTNLGRIVRRAGEDPQAVMTRALEDAFCQDDVMVLDTSGERIYAPLRCENFWGDEQRELFLDQQVAITLEAAATRYRVLVETLAGAQAEFTVGGIWVE